MRINGVGTLAGILLICAGAVTSAPAQQRQGHGSAAPAAAAAPRIVAPAVATQRFTAPPPHTFSAPATRFHSPSTQHFTVQQPLRLRSTSPTVSTRHLVLPPSTLRALRHAPATATQQRHLRLSTQPTTHIRRQVFTPALRHRAITATPSIHKRVPETLTPRIAVPGGVTPQIRKPSTLGQGPAALGRHLTTAAKLVHTPTGQFGVSNPIFTKPWRHDRTSRSLAQSTFHGAFAKAGAWNKDWRWHRHGHRHTRFVIGFVGAVYWPYAYNDYVDYTFWPAAYDTFWPYAFDDLYEGIYGGYAPDIYPYVEGRGYQTTYEPGARRSRTRFAAAPPSGAAGSVCSGRTQGLTDLPIEHIAQQVHPDQNQQALLDELKVASERALKIMQDACPTDLASTPTSRMAAMRERVAAMVQALQTVRPALDKFYAALNDEQEERFNALDAETQRATQGDISQACGSRATAVTDVPFTRIERSLRLTEAQAAALGELKNASAKASEMLAQSCPADQPLTPTGRLAAMEQRLNAMLQALDTVQPALRNFYNALSDEQKARFNRLSPATS